MCQVAKSEVGKESAEVKSRWLELTKTAFSAQAIIRNFFLLAEIIFSWKLGSIYLFRAFF